MAPPLDRHPNRLDAADADGLRNNLPIPPLEMRKLVGPLEESAYDNPTGGLVYPYLPAEAYRAVFDFGCGCGRVARQLLQQTAHRPARYVGIDLHRGMVLWCREHLSPANPAFEFHHHDVFNAGLNPGPDKPRAARFPAEDRAFTLVNAWSVFTHLVEPQVAFYLSEVARILRPDGLFHSTWFLFDKRDFPMMQEFQNALYINLDDPTNAVIYDRAWLRSAARSCGLVITSVFPPAIRGHQWVVVMVPAGEGVREAEFPPDTAPVGLARPPLLPANAERIGLP